MPKNKIEMIAQVKKHLGIFLGKVIDFGFEHSQKIQLVLKTETVNTKAITSMTQNMYDIVGAVNHNSSVLKQIVTAKDTSTDLFTKSKQDEKPN